MLTDDELYDLFCDIESDRVERKESFASAKDKVRQAICAFANDLPGSGLPGVVFIGQKDDGSCVELTIDDELLKTVASCRDDGKILPFPTMSVHKKVFNGCAVAVVIVYPSEQPPVRVDGRTWIRVGPRRAQATVEDERRLAERQVWRNVTFDLRPCSQATLGDLDLTRFELEYVPSATSIEVRRENGRTTLEKLRALRLVRLDGLPTNAAMLLFGIDPRGFFPGAYVQFLRINGKDLTDPLRIQHEINGTIPDQIRQIEELLRLNISTNVEIGAPFRRENSDYPFEALVQLVRNALLHRSYESNTPVRVYWYADRIEIHNPGGLYGEVTSETIWKNVTAYRNPGIAEGLKNLNIVERFGYGLLKVKRSLEENENPPLESEFLPNVIQFTVRAKR